MTVSVDASKVKCEISPWLYVTGMEDVNHEIYGGLDAQRLHGESFEEPCPTGTGDSRQSHGVSASWDKAEALDGGDFIRDAKIFHILDRYRLRWLEVAYEPGELRAVAYGKNGEVLGEETIRTAGDPVAVKLTPEEEAIPADGVTYVFARVCLTDANGVEVPNRKDFVSYALKGPGEILAVGNADPRQKTRRFDQIDGHPLYFGQGGLVLRRQPGATGPIELTATVEGLAPSRVVFK